MLLWRCDRSDMLVNYDHKRRKNAEGSRRCWFLWLDIVAAGVFTTIGLNYVSVMDPNSRTVILMLSSIVISVPVLVWGTLFLVLNRRIINRLDTEAICNTG
ncbi:MAG: hypothetical protein ACI915_001299 [Gammaproteobacteria bacterium]|jgi:hypothetical protein